MANQLERSRGPVAPAVPGGAGYRTSERLNLNPGAAKGPYPRYRLHFQGHDILLQGVGTVSELFPFKEHSSSRPEYLLGFLLPFA